MQATETVPPLGSMQLDEYALDMLDFFGGDLPQDRDWKARVQKYLDAKGPIATAHHDTIYYHALQISEHP